MYWLPTVPFLSILATNNLFFMSMFMLFSIRLFIFLVTSSYFLKSNSKPNSKERKATENLPHQDLVFPFLYSHCPVTPQQKLQRMAWKPSTFPHIIQMSQGTLNLECAHVYPQTKYHFLKTYKAAHLNFKYDELWKPL